MTHSIHTKTNETPRLKPLQSGNRVIHVDFERRKRDNFFRGHSVNIAPPLSSSVTPGWYAICPSRCVWTRKPIVGVTNLPSDSMLSKRIFNSINSTFHINLRWHLALSDNDPASLFISQFDAVPVQKTSVFLDSFGNWKKRKDSWPPAQWRLKYSWENSLSSKNNPGCGLV